MRGRDKGSKINGSKIRHSRENFAEMRGLRSSNRLIPSTESRTRKRDRGQKDSRIRTAAAVLTNQDIFHERKGGNISIYPFHTRNLADSSYCVTIGENYYSSLNKGDYVNPWNKRRVYNQWDGPYKAIKIEDGEMFEKCGIPIGKRAIIIPPEKSILAHTQEFIGGLNFIAGEVRGKLTLAYGGLMLCNECSWFGVGDIDRKTLVIRNLSKSPAVIPVGAKVARVIFHYTGLPKFYLKGEIQSTENLENIVKDWSPVRMLPKPPAKQFSIDKMQNPDFITKPAESYDPETANDPYDSESGGCSDDDDDASDSASDSDEDEVKGDVSKKVSLD